MTARSALVLVAHADDETLACGGTAAKLAAMGWAVEVVIVADGIVRARGTDQDNRPASAAACEILGLQAPTFLGFPDQAFDSVPLTEIAQAVEALDVGPDLVLTHAQSDLNLDHRIVSDVAKIIARPTRKPVSILAGEVPSVTFHNGGAFGANYFVDITDHLERKIAAFNCYENEVGRAPAPWSAYGLDLLARFRGMEAGLGAAEAFQVVRGYEGSLP